MSDTFVTVSDETARKSWKIQFIKRLKENTAKTENWGLFLSGKPIKSINW